MRRLSYHLLFLLFISLLSACGDTPKSSPTSRTMKAVIKPTALTADRNVAGIDLTITVPMDVSPPLLPNGTADPAATVEISSPGSQGQTLPGATYTPATATAPGQLAISAIAAAGFKVTDQITIHLNITGGKIPVESDFKLLFFDAYDIYGAPVLDLNPTLTATIL
jgi:hypothetical protein